MINFLILLMSTEKRFSGKKLHIFFDWIMVWFPGNVSLSTKLKYSFGISVLGSELPSQVCESLETHKFINLGRSKAVLYLDVPVVVSHLKS